MGILEKDGRYPLILYLNLMKTILKIRTEEIYMFFYQH